MELLKLTADNIEQYLDDCVAAQKQLIKPDEPVSREQFIVTAAEPSNYFLGLIDDGRLIGLGLLSKIVHPVRSNGYINNIVVHSDYRGQGLFTTVMDELERVAGELGCTRIELTCSREMVQSMYEKRGYKQKETNFYTKDL